MITTFKIDASTRDYATENGRRVLIEGTAAIAQTLMRHLRTILGEIFTDASKGVPWLEDPTVRPARDYIIGKKNLSTSAVGAILRREALTSPGIIACGAVTVTMNATARTCRVAFTARASTGETIYVNEELP